ncbi:MAG TPA: carbamoyl transferase, partial [Candidatus Aenigmarchaeota archaeon]|nr:carbamoyl transferase [Candidatus Aenigmarchaeota archaeon]
LADYSYPLPEEKNRLLNFFKVDGLRLISRFSNVRRFLELEKILWNCKREEFAYMAQKTLEKHMLQLFINAIEETGLKNVCWSGGVASNIKANRIIRLFSGLKDWFVFPHMGDGGLAVGAALYVDHLLNGCKVRKLENAYLGLEFNDEAIEEELKKLKEVEYEYREDTAELAADLISEENYLFWFKGRMEYGPRALGDRSILAPAWSERVKDELNLKVKRRGWFQPFCPSLLEEESKKFFEDYDGKPDNFMTMGFMSREDVRERIKAVLHVDGSSRPQMVCNENKEYRMLLEKVKKNTGDGIVLNTSFNIHGEPIVCSPRDALETMLRTKTRYMILGNFFVELRR